MTVDQLRRKLSDYPEDGIIKISVNVIDENGNQKRNIEKKVEEIIFIEDLETQDKKMLLKACLCEGGEE